MPLQPGSVHTAKPGTEAHVEVQLQDAQHQDTQHQHAQLETAHGTAAQHQNSQTWAINRHPAGLSVQGNLTQEGTFTALTELISGTARMHTCLSRIQQLMRSQRQQLYRAHQKSQGKPPKPQSAAGLGSLAGQHARAGQQAGTGQQAQAGQQVGKEGIEHIMAQQQQQGLVWHVLSSAVVRLKQIGLNTAVLQVYQPLHVTSPVTNVSSSAQQVVKPEPKQEPDLHESHFGQGHGVQSTAAPDVTVHSERASEDQAAASAVPGKSVHGDTEMLHAQHPHHAQQAQHAQHPQHTQHPQQAQQAPSNPYQANHAQQAQLTSQAQHTHQAQATPGPAPYLTVHLAWQLCPLASKPATPVVPTVPANSAGEPQHELSKARQVQSDLHVQAGAVAQPDGNSPQAVLRCCVRCEPPLPAEVLDCFQEMLGQSLTCCPHEVHT